MDSLLAFITPERMEDLRQMLAPRAGADAPPTAPALLEAFALTRALFAGPGGEDAAQAPAAAAETRNSVCGVCGGPASMQCAGCRAAVYCSRTCQKAGWKGGHKRACGTRNEEAGGRVPAAPAGLDADLLLKRGAGHPLVLRGNRLFSASWGALNQDGCALPPGATVCLKSGGASVRLTGPASAGQVLDAILKLERHEPQDMVYPAAATDHAAGCARCPVQGWCGLRRVSGAPLPAVASWASLSVASLKQALRAGGVDVRDCVEKGDLVGLAAARLGPLPPADGECYEALWSEEFCHVGMSGRCEQVYQSDTF